MRGSDMRGMGILGEMSAEDWGKLLGVILVLAIMVFFVVWIWAYYHPKTASWRQYCVEHHTQCFPVTECTSSSCSTRIESRTQCTRYEWRCTRGQDGSTVCLDPHPEGGGRW